MKKKTILPKLRKIDYSDKKHRYKLNFSTRKRRLAINEGIKDEKKKTKKTLRRAAIAKKGRFNVLRIYRRYKKVNECKKITRDMRYIDKKYKLNKTKNICGKKQKGGKKQFLYNPNNPKKSFDVYIDKNPKDTINIKYTTVNDVKKTIRKLERLYKNKKYTHKRIWQVGMIMKVRLEAMKKYKKTRYKNAKGVNKRYNLSKKYYTFLKKRTGYSEKERKKLIFKEF